MFVRASIRLSWLVKPVRLGKNHLSREKAVRLGKTYLSWEKFIYVVNFPYTL